MKSRNIKQRELTIEYSSINRSEKNIQILQIRYTYLFSGVESTIVFLIVGRVAKKSIITNNITENNGFSTYIHRGIDSNHKTKNILSDIVISFVQYLIANIKDSKQNILIIIRGIERQIH